MWVSFLSEGYTYFNNYCFTVLCRLQTWTRIYWAKSHLRGQLPTVPWLCFAGPQRYIQLVEHLYPNRVCHQFSFRVQERAFYQPGMNNVQTLVCLYQDWLSRSKFIFKFSLFFLRLTTLRSRRRRSYHTMHRVQCVRLKWVLRLIHILYWVVIQIDWRDAVWIIQAVEHKLLLNLENNARYVRAYGNQQINYIHFDFQRKLKYPHHWRYSRRGRYFRFDRCFGHVGFLAMAWCLFLDNHGIRGHS